MAMILVNDLLTWGRLVKSWARRLNYVERPSGNEPPLPGETIPEDIDWKPVMTAAAFNTVVAAVAAKSGVPAGFTVTLPAGIETVSFVQGDDTNLVIRLPPADVVAETEYALLAGQNYTLRPFYTTLFECAGGGAVQMVQPSTNQQRMELHAMRIGDYTISYCQ